MRRLGLCVLVSLAFLAPIGLAVSCGESGGEPVEAVTKPTTATTPEPPENKEAAEVEEAEAASAEQAAAEQAAAERAEIEAAASQPQLPASQPQQEDAAPPAPPDPANAQRAGFLTPDSDVDFADSDGYVPVYGACLPNDIGAFYSPYYDGYAVIGSVIVNVCALERFGAGPADVQQLLAHELGHSRGLLHSSDPSDIMYPAMPVAGS